MTTHCRITFYLKGDESILLEAFVGSERETVKVFFKEKGVPHIRGFLFQTAKKHFESGDWIIVGQQSLVA